MVDNQQTQMETDSISCSKKSNWSQQIAELVKLVNCFNNDGSSKDECVPFIINNTQVGLVPPEVLNKLEFYHDIFYVVRDLLSKKIKYVTMATTLTDKKTRSQQFANVMRDWKDRNLFPTLKGWRNELYSIKENSSGETLLEVERAACCLFGFRTYGVHVNGYVRNDSGDVYMWIARRSKTKPTYPGKLDNTVAGGVTAEDSVLKTVIKECKEEAGIPEKLASTARPAGIVSYFHENELGLFPETQFVFDLELPRSFEPTNTDDEVSDFYLLPIKEVKELIATDEFKPNCALVLLDFFIRHGAIDPDKEPNYMEFAQSCRRSFLY
ncbi:uncharacterized protein LOC130654201 isoform X2 [Hydractinia symbiolongicarpus]|uniref:uncharacterized protein LOC130654201 isoform X2 n=1 Tax=Hydractinia symbiolongicarpus TaxID=13093 RepID=UPI00254E00E8|nr:uncharacterized protein LOC130654201 isoform X2 [Hydractinia symbiolongicarpus]